MGFLAWMAVVGGLLLLLALSSAYLRRLPVSTALIYLLLGIGFGPLGLGWLRLDAREAAPWLERLTEIAEMRGQEPDFDSFMQQFGDMFGDNPPQSCMSHVFKVPAPGLDPRGVDIDTNGVVWTALAASSHLASFDPRKCDLSGPAKLDGLRDLVTT